MRRLFLLLIIALLTLPADAQEGAIALPQTDWFAVIWMPETDTLHWLTATGEVAHIPRPHLPDEAPDGLPQMHVSPDGKMLLLIHPLTDGRTGLGFYDLASGAWTQTHIAQAGERVIVGRHIDRGDYVALGFSTPDTGTWRIIRFAYSTGEAVGMLQSADPIAVIAVGGDTPYVMDYGLDAIHFHLTGDATNATPEAAYAWYPADGTLAPSPYTQAGGDFLYAAGEYLFPFTNGAYPRPAINAADGGNAVGYGDPLNPTTIYADGMTVKSTPRWLAGGAWVAYYAQGEETANWQIVPLVNDGITVQQINLASSVQEVIGTTNGFLAFRADGSMTFTSEFHLPDGSAIFPASDGHPVLIGVTPEGQRPALTQLATPPSAPEEMSNTAQAPVAEIPACDETPPTRLSVGMIAQVIGDVPLRVRSAPDETYLDELPLGATVLITDGAACVNGYLWWGVRYEANGRVLEGWSAEGDTDNYYLEPLAPTPTATPIIPPTETAIAPSGSITTGTLAPTLAGAPFTPPTITPGG